MLPIQSWRIVYADGSMFDSTRGTWAEAPPFGVQAVIYYHVADPSGLQRITKDGGRDNGDFYEYLGEGELEGLKLGLWMDAEGYYRVMDRTGKVSP